MKETDASPVKGCPDSDEFFYINRDGFKDDTDLHGPIIRAVDYPIDEEVMGPIRDKNRAKWLAGLTKDRAWDESKHPRVPKGASGGGQFGQASSTSAALFEPPTRSADEIAASIPGATEAIAKVREKLARGIPTDAPPDKGGYKLADGSYTPERAALHEKIVSHFINAETVKKYSAPEGENPVLTVVGGRGGSGKSWVTSERGPVDTEKSLVIDNDEVKAMLPEYEGWNAALLHEESSDIVAMIDAKAAALGLSVTLDGTLKSTNIVQRIAKYQEVPHNHYEMEGFYIYASPETAATRALQRFKGRDGKFNGRYVPPEVVLGNLKNEANFDVLSSSFRRWEVYDNDDPEGDPKLYQRGGHRERK